MAATIKTETKVSDGAYELTQFYGGRHLDMMLQLTVGNVPTGQLNYLHLTPREAVELGKSLCEWGINQTKAKMNP